MTPKDKKADQHTKRRIAGIEFTIDDHGFVRSEAGDLGHLEDCEAVAKVLTAFFEIEPGINPPNTPN